ncbi:MAG: hypothetical protein ACTHOG_12430 [Marmoricola sp.]
MIQLRRAGIALAALALPLLTSANAAAAPAQSVRPDTSSITIDNVAPATIPAKGTLVIGGVLHNGSSTTWHHVSVTPQTSTYPRTTAAEIAAAAALDPNLVLLGNTMVAQSVPVKDLAPGATARFSIRIPRTAMNITGTPGAYWLGVIPRSDESHPASLTARAFLPLLPTVNKKASVHVALVVPLRDSPVRTTTGALADANGFTRDLSPVGRLGRIATFAQSAAGRPLTWLVDPALLDTADQVAHGTSPYPVGVAGSTLPVPTPLPTSTASPSATSSGTPTPSASPTPSGSPTATPTKGPSAAVVAARLAAGSWLQTVTAALQSSPTYALPYADPAIAPLVATGHADLVTAAQTLSLQSMTDRTLISRPAVAPVRGSLTQSEWATLGADESAFVGPATPTSRSVTSNGRTLIIASAASAGGPGPSTPTSAFNIRQRILAEASVSIGQPTTTELTIVLPATWDPGSATSIADFFPLLTRPWLSFTGLPTITEGNVSLDRSAPRASTKQRANIRAAIALRAAATQLANLLATPTATSDALTRRLDATALSTVSYSSADAPIRYRLNAARTVEALARLQATVRVEGTHFVTLSGSSGVITVALHNGLNQPIRVGLRQTNRDPDTTVAVDPIAPITLDPDERSTLRVHLTARRVSVQEVTLTAVDAHGAPVGTALTFTLRSSPVGAVVWAITIAIVLVLVLVVIRRLRRRLRARGGA